MYFYALTVGYRYSQSCLDVQKVRLPKFYLEVSGMTWHIFHLFFNSPMLPSPTVCPKELDSTTLSHVRSLAQQQNFYTF